MPAISPTLIVQLSDPRIGAKWAGADPAADLAAVVASVLWLQPAPDAVVVSGDLANVAADSEYEQVRELLAPLGEPVYVLPGNQDDRDALHRHFGVPGADGTPVQYAVDVGNCDSSCSTARCPARSTDASTRIGWAGWTPS